MGSSFQILQRRVRESQKQQSFAAPKVRVVEVGPQRNGPRILDDRLIVLAALGKLGAEPVDLFS